MKAVPITLKYLIFALVSLCSACSEKISAPAPAPAPAQGVLSDAQQKVLKDAKQTEQLLKDANQAQLKKIDEITN